MAYTFRHAICNEAFDRWDFAAAAKAIRRAGYTGIEIAPFTLADDPVTVPASRRRELRDIMVSEGLEFVGLHWLMVGPKGLHVTTSDHAVRARSWIHIHSLVDLCADLGPNGLMVFGSPVQRATAGGASREEATRRFVDGLAAVAPHAQQRGVTILLEALPSAQCNVVTSLDEAAGHVKLVGSPALRTMFDIHNALEETEAHTTLVERHYDLMRHVHVNELDGKHPGTGDYNFRPLLSFLRSRNYAGWVSLEAFDFTFGAETIANDSLRYLERQIADLP